MLLLQSYRKNLVGIQESLEESVPILAGGMGDVRRLLILMAAEVGDKSELDIVEETKVVIGISTTLLSVLSSFWQPDCFSQFRLVNGFTWYFEHSGKMQRLVQDYLTELKEKELSNLSLLVHSRPGDASCGFRPHPLVCGRDDW